MSPFNASVAALLRVYSRFDAASRAATAQHMQDIRGRLLPANKSLPVFYECLLFLRAYPANAGMLRATVAELRRVAARLRRYRGRDTAIGEQLGLPYIGATRCYSHECVRWLLRHPHCSVTFDEFSDGTRSLRDVLRLTLPSLERSTADIECAPGDSDS